MLAHLSRPLSLSVACSLLSVGQIRDGLASALLPASDVMVVAQSSLKNYPRHTPTQISGSNLTPRFGEPMQVLCVLQNPLL